MSRKAIEEILFNLNKIEFVDLLRHSLLNLCKSGYQKMAGCIKKNDCASLWSEISDITNTQPQDDLSLQLSRAEEDVFNHF